MERPRRGSQKRLRGRLSTALRGGRGLTDADFERLYDEHAEALLSYLTLRTGDRPLAEDLLADAFERVLRRGDTFDPRRGTEKAWLYSIALNLVRDQARRADAERRATERVRAERRDELDPGLEGAEARATLAAVLGALSDEEREAVALRYGADLTMPEIAELIDEPLSTVEGRVYRALRRLRDRIDDPRSVGNRPSGSYQGSRADLEDE
jgi:RNA polymerase sigma factor (sigma-70 family)